MAMRRKGLRASLPVLLLAVALVGGLDEAAAGAQSATSGMSARLARRNADNALNGVAVLPHRRVWAVGSTTTSQGTTTLIEHWNGRTWRRMRSVSPDGLTGFDVLNGVAAVSGRDVWAVGQQGTVDNSRPLIEHWNGQRWKVVPNPSLGGASALDGLSALSRSSIWAVGYHQGSSGIVALIEHWNGHAWRVTANPSPAPSSSLSGVAVASATNAWAVGRGPGGTLTEHWNGKAWAVVPSPNPPRSKGTRLNGVAITPHGTAWVVGTYLNLDQRIFRTLTEHWNGRSWRIVPSPNGSVNDNTLLGVAAISGSDAWAVGENFGAALIEHWNGRKWRVTPNPVFTRTKFTGLTSVAAVSRSDIWAVGGIFVPVALLWNGHAWKASWPKTTS
jgi:hypothetical protein